MVKIEDCTFPVGSARTYPRAYINMSTAKLLLTRATVSLKLFVLLGVVEFFMNKKILQGTEEKKLLVIV